MGGSGEGQAVKYMMCKEPSYGTEGILVVALPVLEKRRFLKVSFCIMFVHHKILKKDTARYIQAGSLPLIQRALLMYRQVNS